MVECPFCLGSEKGRAALLAASWLFACPCAFAYEDGPGEPDPPATPGAPAPPPGPMHWDGCQTLATDGAALALPAMAIRGDAGPQARSPSTRAVLAREPLRHEDDADRRVRVSRPSSLVAHVEPTLGLAPDHNGGTRTTVGLLGTF